MDKQRQLTYEDLLAIVETIKSASHFSQFRLKLGEIEIELRREVAQRPPAPPPIAPASGATAPDSAMDAAPPAPVPSPSPVPNAPATQARPCGAWPEGSIVVRSPMVGTFYRAPRPGAPPFVEVGQRVAPDAILCIIEVMKLMNSIPAGTRGVVTHILVDDAGPVEYGQPLMVLRPS